jgi:hypothetical protein
MKEELHEIIINPIPGFSKERLEENLNYSLGLDLPSVKLGMATKDTVSICGGGPSLEETLEEITGDIWACNGTHDWLIEKGIIPDYAFFWDAGDKTIEYLQNPNKDVIYLIASQCKPEIFDALKGYRVLIWNAGCDMVDEYWRKNNRPEAVMGGGRACMTRAPFLAYYMGYRDIHLFGADSSLRDDGKSHVGAGSPNRGVRDIVCAGREFNTPTWLAGQAQEFLELMSILEDADIVVHGDGLLPHIARMNGMHYHNVI